MIITLEHINKHFNSRSFFNIKSSRNEVLKDINLNLHAGDFIGIVGPNGSGKSTLLKLIFNLITPSSGHLLLDGSKKKYKKQIKSLACQFNNNDRSFFWRLTAMENIKFFSDVSMLDVSEIFLDKLIKNLGIEKCMSKRFGILSSGEKKKIALLRGLIKSPKIMLFDEFTSSLDIRSKIKIIKNIKDLNTKDNIIIWVTHLPDELQLCNKLLVLDNGRVKKFSRLDENNFNLDNSYEDILLSENEY